MSAWVPINDYPGDQRFDAVPGTVDLSFWGEIGPAPGGRWSWTIISTDDRAYQQGVDGGVVGTEVEAKRAVETWRPR